MSAAVKLGSIFAGYRVESPIGRGGMGVVLRATDLSLQRPVALKLIAPELADDARFRRRFLNESRLAASLDHPNVVPIYEAREQDGQLYLAMRYIQGSDLKTELRGAGRLAPERALAILGQVAAALDAAHRRALVHRDVKPANILIDEDGHAYLTDFGVSKHLGSGSTDTGRLVGTLDYLSPEQIRGERVDERSDGYALACVLYECLAGVAPFHRETEAETLWAHVREPCPPLREHPALDSVLRKALAKERSGRYGGCAELIVEARRVLGLAPSPERRTRVPQGLMRRRRGILAAGLLALIATIAAIAVLMTPERGPRPPPAGNGVAAVDAAAGTLSSFTAAAAAPSNIAVGDGAVWVLSSENRTISRIDPRTRRVVKTIKTGGHPVDLAAGAGAVWIGNAGRHAENKVSVSRVDPGMGRITHTARLPHTPDEGGWQLNGHPGIAVGAGAVWAGNREGTLSRLDPDTGRLVATIDTLARRIAAGPEGVWVVGAENTITRIDPRTNTVGQTIPIGSNYLNGIAVGAGSIWVTSEEGRLWRIEPGTRPIIEEISVGRGIDHVAFGDGVVWTANPIDGTIARIDPRTNTVTRRLRLGAAQALAAGAGSAWVSVAERAHAGVLPASTCGEVASGGAKPDVLIVSDLPLQGPDGAGPRGMADAIRLVLNDQGFRAGRFVVGYRSCDDSTAQTGGYEPRRCAANGDAYAHADRLVAVIGPLNSQCAQVEIPILNRAPGGPIAIVSPSNTFPNLTRGGALALPPPAGRRGEPGVYYPTGRRNYARVIARDDRQGVAQAMLAHQLGLRRVYLAFSAFEAGNISWTDPFRRTAARIGVEVAGVAQYDGRSRAGYRALADRIARTGADGVLVAGALEPDTIALVKGLRARLGRHVTIMAGDEFDDVPNTLALLGRAARGIYVATSELPPAALHLTPEARRFTDEFGAGAKADFALQAAAATEVVMQAIARSKGTRESVLSALRTTDIKQGILGRVRFDRYGDILPPRIAILRITGSSPPHNDTPSHFDGAAIDRVETIPPSLAG